MLGLGLGLTHHRYAASRWQPPAGYVRLTSRLRSGSFITLQGNIRTVGIADLVGRIA